MKKLLAILLVLSLFASVSLFAKDDKKDSTKTAADAKKDSKEAVKDGSKAAKKDGKDSKKDSKEAKKDAKDTKAVAADGLIDINTCSAAQLKILDGIGDAKASDIIKGRPYAKKDQLKSRNILTDAQYAKISDKIIAKQSAKK